MFVCLDACIYIYLCVFAYAYQCISVSACVCFFSHLSLFFLRICVFLLVRMCLFFFTLFILSLFLFLYHLPSSSRWCGPWFPESNLGSERRRCVHPGTRRRSSWWPRSWWRPWGRTLTSPRSSQVPPSHPGGRFRYVRSREEWRDDGNYVPPEIACVYMPCPRCD